MNNLDYNAGLDDLAAQFGTAQSLSMAFRAELERVQTALRGTERESSSLSRSLGSSLRSAFEGVLFDGEKVSDVLRNVGRSLANTAFSSAIRPLQNAVGKGVDSLFGGLFGGSLFADGAAFSAGRVRAFASGGVVDGPTMFPMRGGAGLMGEAGPEAIMPLARGADGKLGVRGAGGGAVQVTMNITTPDVEGFRRSRSQIAASFSRALRAGQRNL
ncbi:MAG: phage tail tape measure protein [Alphaproteobacteria bacterium]|nr:MAG: phage tail tape measure protein [Alphaproteobacteria bacterium]